MEDKNKSILYRPILEPEKDYYSEGTIIDNDMLSEEITEEASVSIVDTEDKLNSIKKNIKILPQSIINLIKPQLDGVEKIYNKISDIKIDNSPPQRVVRTVEKTENNNTDPDDVFYNTADEYIVKIEETDKIDFIKKQYAYDMNCIINDYLNKLDTIIREYAKENIKPIAFVGAKNASVLDTEYDITANDIGDKNLLHLNDVIHKSQIIRNQKERLHKKLYDNDSMHVAMRLCEIALSEKLRYESQYYEPVDGFMSLSNSNLLRYSVNYAEKKYKESFANLYKYLNSSVISISECVKLQINESFAKANILIREGYLQ